MLEAMVVVDVQLRVPCMGDRVSHGVVLDHVSLAEARLLCQRNAGAVMSIKVSVFA